MGGRDGDVKKGKQQSSCEARSKKVKKKWVGGRKGCRGTWKYFRGG